MHNVYMKKNKKIDRKVTVCGFFVVAAAILFFGAIAQSAAIGGSLPIAGEWEIDAGCRTYRVSISPDGGVGCLDCAGYTWETGGNAMIATMAEPFADKRNRFLIVKVNGDTFFAPYEQGAQEFSGVGQLTFRVHGDTETRTFSSSFKMAMAK